jgi:hypothetical protein
MRFDLHKVRTYLVNELQNLPSIDAVTHDGTDIILLRTAAGQDVIVHLIERSLSLNEIKTTLTENNAAGRHTLFILWADMLLPQEERLYVPDDWMDVLLALYDGKIYGYDTYGKYISVFPVYFERQPGRYERYIRYGDSIDPSKLRCDYVEVQTAHLSGYWRMADFDSKVVHHRTGGASNYASSPGERSSMSSFYAVLSLPQDADKDAIRAAYRRLAREYHPDLNQSPDATVRMQAINVAYDHIMRQFGDESPAD